MTVLHIEHCQPSGHGLVIFPSRMAIDPPPSERVTKWTCHRFHHAAANRVKTSTLGYRIPAGLRIVGFESASACMVCYADPLFGCLFRHPDVETNAAVVKITLYIISQVFCRHCVEFWCTNLRTAVTVTLTCFIDVRVCAGLDSWFLIHWRFVFLPMEFNPERFNTSNVAECSGQQMCTDNVCR